MLLRDNPFGTESVVAGYIAMILALSMVFVGVHQYRERELGGALSIGKGLVAGLMISLIATVCYVLGWEFWYQTVMTDFPERYSQHLQQRMLDDGASADAIQRHMRENAEWLALYKSNILVRFGLTAMEFLPIAILAAVAAALVFRRHKNGLANGQATS